MRPTALHLTAVTTAAQTYHFRGHDFGWALITVNDLTGELLIVSDWGNWAHGWNPRHIGAESLTHFLAAYDRSDYLIGKLTDRLVFDAEATSKALCEELLRIRREHVRYHGRKPHRWLREGEKYLDHGTLCKLREDLEGLADITSEELYTERLPRELFEYLSEPWHYYEQRESNSARDLRTIILPALFVAVREEVERRFRSMSTAAQLILAAVDGARSAEYRESERTRKEAAKAKTEAVQ